MLTVASASEVELTVDVPAALIATPVTASIYVEYGDPMGDIALAKSNVLSFVVAAAQSAAPSVPTVAGNVGAIARKTSASDLTNGQATVVQQSAAIGVPAVSRVENFFGFNVPGATRTRPNDVNNLGVIVGRYDDASGVIHGFMLDHGVYTTVDYPGAATSVLLGINDSGQVVGRFMRGGVEHGFLLSGGAFVEIDYPGAVGTQCHGIDSNGRIVGRYYDWQNPGQGGGWGRRHEHGFILSDDVFRSVDFPEAETTDAWKIADSGDLIGDWSTNATDTGSLYSGAVHGYILRDGQFDSLDFPGALVTAPREVNSGGQMVGIYIDAAHDEHGFVRVGDEYSSFDFPGSTLTDGSAINDRGQIVGSYEDGFGVEHGYVASVTRD